MLHAFRNRPLWCLAAGLLAASAWAQSVRGPQEPPEARVDYSVARREIQSLEAAINGAIGSTFTGLFAQVGKTKGVYLQGYGLMFDFLVNIQRSVTSTPFGEFRDPRREISPEQKKRRIEELKEKLVRLLVERGDSLRQLRKGDELQEFYSSFREMYEALRTRVAGDVQALGNAIAMLEASAKQPGVQEALAELRELRRQKEQSLEQ